MAFFMYLYIPAHTCASKIVFVMAFVLTCAYLYIPAHQKLYFWCICTYLYILAHQKWHFWCICTYLCIPAHTCASKIVFFITSVLIYAYLSRSVHTCTYLRIKKFIFWRICTYLRISVHICAYLYILHSATWKSNFVSFCLLWFCRNIILHVEQLKVSINKSVSRHRIVSLRFKLGISNNKLSFIQL